VSFGVRASSRQRPSGHGVLRLALGVVALATSCATVTVDPADRGGGDGDGGSIAASNASSATSSSASVEATSSTAGVGGAGGVDCMPGDPCSLEGWSRRLGEAGSQRGEAVAFDGSGNVIIAGVFSARLVIEGKALDAADGSNAAFVAALDAETGALRWATQLGAGSEHMQGISVAAGPNGQVVVAGTSRSPFSYGDISVCEGAFRQTFLIAFDVDGALQFARCFQSTTNRTAVAMSADGIIALGAAANDPIDWGTGQIIDTFNGDAVLATYDGAGRAIWARSLVGYLKDATASPSSVPTSISFDAEGRIHVAGRMYGSRDLDGLHVDAAPDEPSTFVMRISRSGETDWTRALVGGAPTQASIAVDDSGGTYVASTSFTHFVDAGGAVSLGESHFAALDAEGALRWSGALGDGQMAEAAIVADHLGGAFLLAEVGDPSNVALSRIDASGTVVSTETFGSGFHPSMALRAPYLALTGSTRGEAIDFGNGPLVGSGVANAYEDVFVAHIAR
jgi:outer membrane protein assembly factor BamB